MRKTLLQASLPIGLIVAVIACTKAINDNEPPPGDPELIAYLDEEWGIRFFRTYWETGTEKGGEFTFMVVQAEVDGLGSRELEIEEVNYTDEPDGIIEYMIADVQTDEDRFFTHNTVENYISFSDPEEQRGVYVSGNTDGTYEIWTYDDVAGEEDRQTVPDGYQALRVVEEYSAFKDAPPHVLLMAFAMAQSSPPENRVSVECTAQLTDYDQAPAPAPCDLFKEFCECAACLVLEREGACEPCPDL